MPRSIYEITLCLAVGTVRPVRSFIYTLITRNLDDVPSPENDSLDSVGLVAYW
jgi:hypothetical protein